MLTIIVQLMNVTLYIISFRATVGFKMENVMNLLLTGKNLKLISVTLAHVSRYFPYRI